MLKADVKPQDSVLSSFASFLKHNCGCLALLRATCDHISTEERNVRYSLKFIMSDRM